MGGEEGLLTAVSQGRQHDCRWGGGQARRGNGYSHSWGACLTWRPQTHWSGWSVFSTDVTVETGASEMGNVLDLKALAYQMNEGVQEMNLFETYFCSGLSPHWHASIYPYSR